MWIDTHCHLDAEELGGTLAQKLVVRQRAAGAGVQCCVIPAVQRSAFDAVRELAHATGDAYALGIHPLYVPLAQPADLDALDHTLSRHIGDARLVALGEMGLDHFVPALCTPAMRERQSVFLARQLVLAQEHGLPVLLHVRRSADALLAALRRARFQYGGIAHAFNGSLQQARAFLDLGFKLGFGGALTFERALQLRRLVTQIALEALVLETDAPDMPPHWLYVTARQRGEGRAQGVNEPAQVPRIAEVVARLRGIDMGELMRASTRNAMDALPRLQNLLTGVNAHDAAN